MSFIEKLDEKSLEVFNEAANKSCSEQAVFFLNAFWEECGSQAEFIYSISSRVFKQADMKAKNVAYIHLYEEGASLDFDMGVYLFEQVFKFWDEPTHEWFKPWGFHAWTKKHPNFKTDFKQSEPGMMTSIARKKELKEKVDVNFDGRVSMLEYLMYQYQVSPKDLVTRSMNAGTMHPEVAAAMQALAEVQKRVNAYEAEKQRLTDGANEPGVKGLRMKNELAQLNASPLWDAINKALITAEAAVRIATRKYGAGGTHRGDAGAAGAVRSDGSIWWMNRELQEKQEHYGGNKKAAQ